jgi:hypothetical protein
MADKQREGWRNVYRAAMLETDVEKFRERAAEAQKAIIERSRELGRDGAGNAAERQALADALQDLRVLSKDGSGSGW